MPFVLILLAVGGATYGTKRWLKHKADIQSELVKDKLIEEEEKRHEIFMKALKDKLGRGKK